MAATRKPLRRSRPPESAGNALRIETRRSLGYLLRDCYRSFSRALEAKIKPHGIGVGQWYILRELWAEDGLTQGELSLRAGISAPTTVVAIRRMVEDGLVLRKEDDRDRRKLRIHLTRRGRGYRDQLLPLALEITDVATKGFTHSELRQFRSLIDRIKTNLSGS